MPTPRHQQELLQRLNESFRHGTVEIRKALSSNSLQKSPTVVDNKDGKKNNSDNQSGGNQNKRNKKKGNGQDAPQSSGTSGNSRDGSSNTNGEAKVDKKTKRKLDIATTCSLHGLNAGHTDILCFDDHTTEENKKKIEANRADVKMKHHFRELDHAAKKRKTGN